MNTIWGYEYHPLRHDPLVYATIGRFRQLLGRHEAWVEWTESGYRPLPRARLVLLKPVEPESQTSAQNTRRADAPALIGEVGSQLNYRQVQAMELLRQRQFIGVSDYARIFEVSKITASRDLSELRDKGWVRAFGRARATQYSIAPRVRDKSQVVSPRRSKVRSRS